MNEFEARLYILRTIRDVLVDLAVEDEVGDPGEFAALEEAMSDAASLIMEALAVEVLSVDGTSATLRVSLPS